MDILFMVLAIAAAFGAGHAYAMAKHHRQLGQMYTAWGLWLAQKGGHDSDEAIKGFVMATAIAATVLLPASPPFMPPTE